MQVHPALPGFYDEGEGGRRWGEVTAVASRPSGWKTRRSTAFFRLTQCDGSSAYDALCKLYAEIRLAACLAHIRRKFFEAREQSPEFADAI